MKNFEECRKEWLKYEREEKILISEIKKKIEIVLNQQKEMGNYFRFPHYETFNKVKRHHWFFHKIEEKSIFKCPCCNSEEISDSYVKLGCDYFKVYECPSCNYFSIDHQVTTPYNTFNRYNPSIQSLRKFNSQLDKHLNKQKKNV